MTEYFAMSGYAAYIWSAYGVTAIVLIGLWLLSARALRERQAEIDRAEANSPRRRTAP